MSVPLRIRYGEVDVAVVLQLPIEPGKQVFGSNVGC